MADQFSKVFGKHTATIDQVWSALGKKYKKARQVLHIGVRGHLFGLTVSNNGTDSDHDLDIAVGEASSDDTDPVLMKLTSALAKQLDATFAEGTAAGGFASGESLPTSGTIHIWLIGKTDGTTDVFANDHATSGLSPTLPTGYTYKRRIGSRLTDGSANLVAALQEGDNVWVADSQVLDSGTPATSLTAFTLNVPLGIKVGSIVHARIFNSSTGGSTGSFHLAGGDETTDRIVAQSRVANQYDTAFCYNAALTNTSAQIKYKVSGSNIASVTIRSGGWIDRRGRDG